MADGAFAHRAGRSARDRIVFLGHATVLIELDGVRLLTDPLLRGRVAHLRRQVAPVDPGVFAGTDAVLISHLHHDHLDLASLRLLGLDTSLLVPAGAGELLRPRGFTDVTELSAGQVTGVAGAGAGAGARAVAGADAGAVGAGAVAVTAVRARHDGRRHPGGPRAETLGYVMRGRRTVYFAGDTELFDGMSDLWSDPSSGRDVAPDHDVASGRDTVSGHDVAPGRDTVPGHDVAPGQDTALELDVALLPVAGWGSRLGPGHMDPLDAARAASLLRPRVAIPIHWGTLQPIGAFRRRRERLDPPRQFAEHVARLAPDVEVTILEPGQQTLLASALG